MACRDSGGSIILLCLGLLGFVTSLCQCTSLTRLKALDESNEKSTQTQSEAQKSHQHHGRLLIGLKSQLDAKLSETNSTKEVLEDDADYQADMGWWQIKQLGEGMQQEPLGIERLLRMEPKVECTGDSMKLLVQGATSTPATLLFVDRGSDLSPLSLSKLPSSCGYTVRSTRRDLVLVAPYSGCFVSIEEDSYVLPLRWCGLQVRMSCPLMRQMSTNPPMVTCHSGGMVVTTQGTNSAVKIRVNVNGEWEPLLQATKRCMFSIVEHPDGVVISIRYAPCIVMKDGLYRLELATDQESKISCPSLYMAQLGPTKSPATDGPQQPAAPPDQNMQRIPGFPQDLQNLNIPNQKPKEMPYPHFPYYNLHPSFLYPHHTSPDAPPTVQPQNPSLPPVVQGTRSPHLPPFYPQSHINVMPSRRPSVTKPPGKDKLHPGHVALPPVYPQKPTRPHSSQHKFQPKPSHPFLFHPHHQFHIPHLQPMDPKKVPKKPLPSHTGSHVKPQAEYQPFYYYYPQQKPDGKPSVSQPSQPGAPPFYPFHLYNQSKPDSSFGQMYQPFYFNMYGKQDPPSKQFQTSKPLQSQIPGGQMYQMLHSYNQTKPYSQMYHPYIPYNLYSQQKPASKPSGGSHPQTPHDQYNQFFYPYYVYNQQKQTSTAVPQLPHPKPSQAQQPPRPAVQPPSKPSAPQKPQPGAPDDLESQQMCVYSQLVDQSRQLNMPVGAPGSATEVTQVLGPCQPFKMPSSGTSGGTLVEKQIPGAKPLQGPMFYPYNLFYPLQSQYATLPPSTNVQQMIMSLGDPKQPASPGQSTAVPPQDPQLSGQFLHPAHCSQFCLYGYSNCCPQIAFHQHLHIAPASLDKDAPWFYPGLPLMSLMAYTEFNNGLEAAPVSEKVSEGTASQNMAHSSFAQAAQSPPKMDVKPSQLHPPDGNPTALPGSGPSKAKNELPFDPLLGESLHPFWTYLSQNMGGLNLQSPSVGHYNDPSGFWSVDKPVMQYQPHQFGLPKQKQSQYSVGSDPSSPAFMPYIHPSLAAAKELQSLNKRTTEQKRYLHDSQHEMEQFFSPHYMPQDAPVPTQNGSVPLNYSQAKLFEIFSKNFTKHEQTLNSQPQSFVLLQHGPPGRKPSSLNDPVSYADVIFGEKLNTEGTIDGTTLTREPLQENIQEFEGMPDPLIENVNLMPRLDEPGFQLPFSAADDPLQVHSSPEQSQTSALLKPDDLWKSQRLSGSSQMFPPHFPGNMFQFGLAAEQPIGMTLF
uniref:ZP domain-containing protein n=1 Tax=Oryzias latipes TaxID=8090 RepID=A0A3P9HI20_ORYLA